MVVSACCLYPLSALLRVQKFCSGAPFQDESLLISVKGSDSSNGCFSEQKKLLRGKKSLPKFSSWFLLLMWGGCMVFFIANEDVDVLLSDEA